MTIAFRLATSLVAATLAVTVPALAEDLDPAAPGRAQSTSFAAFAPNVGLAVRPLNDSRANLRLRDRFVTALKRRAVRVQEAPAPIVLNFETEIERAIGPNDSVVGALTADSRGTEIPVNLWPTAHDSVLRGRQADGFTQGLLRYVLIATLDDERTGRRLWQGQARYTGAPADEDAALSAMVPILTEQLGRTVRQRSFWLE